MANENKENNMDVSAPKEHRFGVQELSDVVFVVGDQRFHCHRMMLAARSHYFAAMFTSNFKEKDQGEVTIDANPRSFRWLMEILYNGQMTNYRFLWDCQSCWSAFPSEKEDTERPTINGRENCAYVHPGYWLWREASLLLDLADRFLVLEIVRPAVEHQMLHCEKGCEEAKACSFCATKLLIAIRYKLSRYEEANISNKEAIVKALAEMNQGGEKFDMSINSEELQKLLTKP